VSSEKINHTLSAIFRATRKFHSLKQTEFATILGTTQGTVSKIENELLNPELILWFNFLKIFKITSSSCFSQDGAEFIKEVFKDIEKNGSPLIPKFSFNKGKSIFNIRRIRPFFEIFRNNHAKEFESFLKKHKVDEDIFYILNHPLTFEFVDVFFTFLKECKINEKSMPFLDFNFNFANADQTVVPFSESNMEMFFDDLNSDDSFIKYELDLSAKTYRVSVKPEQRVAIDSLASKEFILNYSLLYPYYFLTSNKELATTKPIVREVQKDTEWTVAYAG